jgi:hypothetical protein
MSETDNKAVAAAVRQLSRDLADLATLLDGNVPGDSDLTARQIATLMDFDVPESEGLNRAQASRAFKEHGLNPRSFGSWVQGGYLARIGDRRFLTDKGRGWIARKGA